MTLRNCANENLEIATILPLVQFPFGLGLLESRKKLPPPIAKEGSLLLFLRSLLLLLIVLFPNSLSLGRHGNPVVVGALLGMAAGQCLSNFSLLLLPS